MKPFSFGMEAGRHVDRFGSNFVMSRLVQTEQLHVGCMRLAARGLVGGHEAATYQLFAVVEGEGWVRTGGGDLVSIRSGEAVLWQPGEWHSAGTDSGMTVMVVEGDALESAPESIGPVGAGPGSPA